MVLRLSNLSVGVMNVLYSGSGGAVAEAWLWESANFITSSSEMPIISILLAFEYRKLAAIKRR